MDKKFEFKKKSITFWEYFEYWEVLLLIIASGSFYFQVLRMPLTGAMLVLTTLIILYRFKKVSIINFRIILIILGVIFFNTLFNIRNGFNYTDAMIMLIKLTYLLSMQSNMTFHNFKKKYVKMMFWIATLSLVCFLWVDVLRIGTLPLQHYEYSDAGLVNITPYYTVGWSDGPFGRNAGPFGEPGSYQIFLNIALLYLFSGNEIAFGWSKKKHYFIMIILITTILTTQSATAYMVLFIVLVSKLFSRAGKRKVLNKYKILSIVFIAIFLLIESKFGIIEHKLNGGGSYNTRSNDTIGGYALALTRPIMGYGLFQTNKSSLLKLYGIGMISNGLASLTISAGLVLTGVYIFEIFRGTKRQFNEGIAYTLLVFLVYILILNAEGGALNLIFLYNIFRWKKVTCN